MISTAMMADGSAWPSRSSDAGILRLPENARNVEKLVGSGAYTINDVRRAANQAIINEPWADEHYMTLNISTMGQATRPLTQEGGEVE